MLTRVSCIVSCLLISGSAIAQNAPAAPVKGPRPAVREHLVDSAIQRLQWEAAQTWDRPAIPTTDAEPRHHAIHIDQPRPARPRVRREWLQPSSEPVTSDAMTDVDEALNSHHLGYAHHRQQVP
jgi:hypothetical protein